MRFLPEDIKCIFYKFLDGEESLSNFEQWVYATNDLEKILNDADYLKLISLDFSKQDAKYELDKLLKSYIDISEYETWKLRKLLNMFLDKKENLAQLLSQFYELYCDGYYFLDILGLGYGLLIQVPPSKYSSEVWEGLSNYQKTELLESLLPEAMNEAQKVLSWLDTNKIVITNEQNYLGYCSYIDRRSESEKKPISYKISESSNSQQSRKWWKFWR